MPEHSRVRSDPDAPRLIVLELDAVVERGELVMRWGFNPELHEAASVERLAEAQLTELAGYA